MEVPDHQLVMDLDRCVSCCNLVITKVFEGIADFHGTGKGGDMTSMRQIYKLKVWFKTKGIRDLQECSISKRPP